MFCIKNNNFALFLLSFRSKKKLEATLVNQRNNKDIVTTSLRNPKELVE